MASVDEDHRSDRRFAYAVGGLMAAEVVLAAFADAGAIPLWLWLVLAVVEILVAGLWTFLVQRGDGRPNPGSTGVGGQG